MRPHSAPGPPPTIRSGTVPSRGCAATLDRDVPGRPPGVKRKPKAERSESRSDCLDARADGLVAVDTAARTADQTVAAASTVDAWAHLTRRAPAWLCANKD